MNFTSGKDAGTTFEKVFERACHLSGLWAEPNHIRAKPGWNGRLQKLKSKLDYDVMGRGGKLSFVDCKTFDNPYFTFSDIPSHQLGLAARYNEFGFSSGFVVWFRPINTVSFFSGWLIQQRGPGTRFLPQDGIRLGTWERFTPELAFSSCAMGSTNGMQL